MGPGLSLREDTGDCGGGTALGQGACDVRGALRFSHCPCLFLHYINDLREGIVPTVRLFADATVMYLTIASQTGSHKLQADLNNLATWDKIWQTQFHPDKCRVLRITNYRKPIIFNYTLHDHILATVTQAKYLGVTITNYLN